MGKGYVYRKGRYSGVCIKVISSFLSANYVKISITLGNGLSSALYQAITSTNGGPNTCLGKMGVKYSSFFLLFRHVAN